MTVQNRITEILEQFMATSDITYVTISCKYLTPQDTQLTFTCSKSTIETLEK